MEKHVIRWTYLLGVGCLGAGVLWRGGQVLGWLPEFFGTPAGGLIAYSTFLRASLLFLVLAIATIQYAQYKRQGS